MAGDGRRVVGTPDDKDGVRIEVLEFDRKGHRLIVGDRAVGTGPDGASVSPYVVVPHTMRQLRVTLTGGAGIVLEPGALQYSKGRLDWGIRKMEGAGGFVRRRFVSAGTGDSAHQTVATGDGVVHTEPTSKYLMVVEMGPGEEALLDDGAFYAMSASMKISVHTHRGVRSMFAGSNGLMQPKVTGPGLLVLETGVPEIECVTLAQGETLVVDGDLVLMYDASIRVDVGTLVPGLRDTLRSGEGLVYTFRGEGNVFMVPGLPVSKNLAD